MKAFEYAAPRSEAEAVSLLSAEPGKTEVLAGGTDLVGLMKKMIVTPDRVVNIMEVPSMRAINPQADGGLVIGAAATLDTLLESNYLGDFPAVTQAIRGINSMQLQAQGTLGGELCQRPRCWEPAGRGSGRRALLALRRGTVGRARPEGHRRRDPRRPARRTVAPARHR